MIIKKFKKVYRIFFPKKFTSHELFEHKLNQNRELASYIKESSSYLARMQNSLILKIRDESHSDYLVFEQVFNLRQYEILLSIINLNIHSENKKIIIDAGANVGYTSLYFLNNLNNLFIYAIEPSPENAFICRENIGLNKLENKINLYQMALSHKKGLKFNLNNQFRDSKDWAITTEHDVDGEVDGIALSEIISNNEITNITLLKMDIEGAEQYIFDVKSDLSFLKITSLIAIEIHDEFNIRDSIYKTLKEYGYFIFESGELTLGINTNLMTI